MHQNDMILPVAVSIRVDDVGWFEGADERHLGLPSRSGLPRRHDPRDILTLNDCREECCVTSVIIVPLELKVRIIERKLLRSTCSST